MDCIFYKRRFENKCSVFTETPMGGECSPARFKECKYCMSQEKAAASKETARQNYIKRFGKDEYEKHGYFCQGLTAEQLRATFLGKEADNATN